MAHAPDSSTSTPAARAALPSQSRGGDPVFGHRVRFTADPPPPQPPSVLLTGTVQLDMRAEPGVVSWGTLRPHQAAEQVVDALGRHVTDRLWPAQQAEGGQRLLLVEKEP